MQSSGYGCKKLTYGVKLLKVILAVIYRQYGDEEIKVNPIQNVESLSKVPEKPRDALSFEKIALPPPLSSYPLLLLNVKFI